jgi:hypothetical protein
VTVLEELLLELQETLDVEGMVPLYDFSWTLRGMKRGLSEDQIATLCKQGFDQLTQQHSVHLEWFEWPATDLHLGRRAEPGTPLDFDINSTGEIESPFLALVPDQS